jgi:hypothetical protein
VDGYWVIDTKDCDVVVPASIHLVSTKRILFPASTKEAHSVVNHNNLPLNGMKNAFWFWL